MSDQLLKVQFITRIFTILIQCDFALKERNENSTKIKSNRWKLEQFVFYYYYFTQSMEIPNFHVYVYKLKD